MRCSSFEVVQPWVDCYDLRPKWRAFGVTSFVLQLMAKSATNLAGAKCEVMDLIDSATRATPGLGGEVRLATRLVC